MSFPYLINDVVLARVPNGKIYYTKIRSISLARKECVTEFDDGSIATVDWTNIFDVAAETDVIVCVVCKQGESEPPNEIILCDTCNVGYHQKCHFKKITSQQIAQDKWHCHYCLTKGKNPHVINPFENSRTRSPSKRKRKLRKVEPKPIPKPKKRRKLQRTPPKPSKTTKSYVAKKCTVSIVKKSIKKVQSLAPEPSSDGSSCSSDEAEPVSHNSPETRTETRPITPPVSLPLPHRPVNAVQPLNHSMVYPACTPPPLQMSPLIKKTPRVISCSPPPLITPRDVTTNRDVIMSMSSLPPLQKARVTDCDPLRDASKASVSPFEKTGTTVQQKKSPVECTQPVEPSVITNEAPKSSENIETSESIPEPSASQPPPGPSATGSVSGISSEQIRGLYMRLYDFLQQTRAQGNPVIDRDVVQHLISYGNEQIQRLSTTNVSSNSEQMESTNTLTERCNDSRSSVEIKTCTSTLSTDKEVESMPSDQLQQSDSKKSNQGAAEKGTESPANLDEKICGLEDLANSFETSTDQTKSSSPKSSCMNEVECVNLSQKLNLELSEVSKASSPVPATTEKTVEAPISVVEKQSNLTENLLEGTVDLSPTVNSKTSQPQELKSGLSVTPIMAKSAEKSRSNVQKPSNSSGDLMKAASKPTLSTKPIQIVSSSSTIHKSGIKSKSWEKMVCQPLPPAGSELCVGQHAQRKLSKTKPLKGPANKKSSSKPRSVTIPRKRKTEEKKCSNSASGKKSSLGSFSESSYTAVQAGNSVIIKPNSGNDIPTENSVPVQFLSGQSAALQTKSCNQLSMICHECPVNEELRAGEKEKAKSSQSSSSVLHSLTLSKSTSLPLESPKICAPALPHCGFTDIKSGGNCPPSLSSVSDTFSTFPTTNSEPAASGVSFPTPSTKSDVLHENSGSYQPEANNQAKTLHSFEQESKAITLISSATLNMNSKEKESLEKSAPLSCAERSVTTPTPSTTDTISTKPQLRSNSSSSSDIKKACPSNRSTLTRGSKIQAKDNIKSFTIFDSYSSLFDSDDDDDVYVSQKPVSQVSSEPPKRFPGYNQTSVPTSTRDMNSIQDSPSSYVSSAPVERSSSDQMSAQGINIVQATEAPSVAAVFSLDDLIDIQEDTPIQVSSTDIPSTSTSAALLNPLESFHPDNSITTPFQSDKDPSELFTSSTTFSPSLTSPPFDFEQFQHDTQTPDIRDVESPAPHLDAQSAGQKDQPLIAAAQHISRMFHHMLLMASAKCASEIAVRATVIKLREERVSRNVLTATLLHSLLSAASKNTIRPISPLQTANHRPATPPTTSLNQTSFPSISSHSQNQSTLPITTTYHSRSINPLATGQNPGSVVVSQSVCPVSLSDTSNLEVNTSNLRGAPSPNETRSGTVVETPAPLNNDQNNKNGITGQCYNCYSPALIACRKCSDALYCSLRCELEHLAIHRRECCKRQS